MPERDIFEVLRVGRDAVKGARKQGKQGCKSGWQIKNVATVVCLKFLNQAEGCPQGLCRRGNDLFGLKKGGDEGSRWRSSLRLARGGVKSAGQQVGTVPAGTCRL